MTDQDQNAIDALCSLEIPRSNGGNVGVSCGMYSRLTPDRARGILDAIRAGKVPGISDDAGIASMERQLDAAAKALDALRAERDEAIERRNWWFARSEEHKDAGYKELMKRQAAEAERDAALAKVREVEGERDRLREHHAFYQSIQSSQQSHQSLCARVADAAIRAGVVYNFGACGGGSPSFAAIVSKIEDAIANCAKLKADNERLRGLLGRIVNTGHLPTCFRLKPDPSCPRCEAVRDAFKELGR